MSDIDLINQLPKDAKTDKKRKAREKEDQKVTISAVGSALIDLVETKVATATGEEGSTVSVSTPAIDRSVAEYKSNTKIISREVKRQKRFEHKKHLKENFSIVYRVFKFAKKDQWLLWLTCLFDVAETVLALFIPAILGKSIDCIVGKGNVNMPLLLQNITIMCVLILCSAACKWTETVATNVYCIRASKATRERLFKKFNKVPLSVIDNNQHGDLLDRMVNDVEDMTYGFLDSIQSVFSGVFSIVGTIVFMLMLNLKMAAIIILVTPLSLFFTYFIAKKSRTLFNRMAKAQGDISGHMEEYFSGQKIVKTFGHEEQSIKAYESLNKEFYVVSEKAQFLSKLIGPITRFINGLVYGLVGLFGSIFAIRGQMSVGMISTFLTYSNSFGKPFTEIADEISNIQSAFASARRVFDMLEKKDEPSDENLPALDVADGSLELKNVCFSYIPKQKLIENLNLEVKPGQKVAIVGPTGCGKSTLINLIMRFYDVNSGEIIFSGKNVNAITRASLRTKYGMVLQESWLFAGTVFDNIAYGKPNATQEEVEEAAKMAGAHEFILKMKNGYKTQIEEGGGNVSQGQKQLLCIARIMLIKPPMLILDEATSNIDTNTEMKIQTAFNAIMQGRTSFIIAHRLSTITNADMILVMNKGNVIEKGNHQELMEKKGFYYHLYQSQFR